jgi:hypothetical protein
MFIHQVNRLPYLLLFIVLTSCQKSEDPLRKEIAALRLSHPAGYFIPPGDIRKIVQLAHAGGIKQVATIDPAIGQARNRNLIVKGPEIVEGRRMSFDEMLIHDWLSIPVPSSEHGIQGVRLMGGAAFCSREWATFIVDGKETRVACSRETDLAKADAVFSAIAAGDIEYSGDGARERNFNFALPTEISIKQAEVFIAFKTSDRFCWVVVRGKLSGARLLITSSGTICA